MLAYYENRSEGISIEWKPTVHVPPHLHEAIEIVYVTDGTLALGVGQELYQMDTGDFAIVFPNVIHHYQAFGTGKNKAIYLFVDSSLLLAYHAELQKYSPVYPIIKKKQLYKDVVNAMKSLIHMEERSQMLVQAYIQMILAHVFSDMSMVDKSSIGSDDLIYNGVEYVAKNFRDEIKLDKMAYDLE